MNRRRFLHTLGLGAAATAATMAFDPELALWRPGAKTFFLPSPASSLALHPHAFAFAWPDVDVSAFVKALADDIDRRALQAYGDVLIGNALPVQQHYGRVDILIGNATVAPGRSVATSRDRRYDESLPIGSTVSIRRPMLFFPGDALS